jgi:hypothetical protein
MRIFSRSFCALSVRGCLSMLDIIAHVVSRQTEVVDNYMTYILDQDSIMLEGKVDHSFKNGELCIICGKGTDNIVRTPGRDTIAALEGDDTVHALDGDDLVCACPGDDRIFGEDDRDPVDGGIDNS